MPHRTLPRPAPRPARPDVARPPRAPLVRTVALALLAALSAASACPGPGEPVRAAVLADVNGPYGATSYPPAVHRALAEIRSAWRPDLVLMPGDLVAGQSRDLPDARFAEMWAAFDRDVAAPLRSAGIPWIAAAGNHDGSSLPSPAGGFAFARERDAARAYHAAPGTGALPLLPGGDAPFAGGARCGDLFVAVLDASSARLPTGALEALAAELARPEATSARWRVVIGHLPAFGVARGKTRPGEVLAGGDAFLAALAAMGADAYVSGHHAAPFDGTAEGGAADGFRLVHAGGIGGRGWLGSDAPPRPAVLLLEFDPASGAIASRAWDPAAGAWLDPAAAPERIEGIGGATRRSPTWR